MNPYEVILRPLITEQCMHLASKRGAYTFEVAPKANKVEIRDAVQRLYNVKVEKVRTANHMGKMRRRGKSVGRAAGWKKAVVYLKPEYHIDLF
ncbi:MAG: 50S ribosomal protein L23 [Phycisphaerae bacterium]|nr:50S ribosomal protein L23 [Phycisphaerae bacterium]